MDKEEQTTFISCVSWILRGYAATAPKQIEMTEEQINEMKSDPMVREGLLQSQPTDQMDEEDQDSDNMPIFGDDLNDLMNSKSNYPMVIEQLSDDEKQDFYIKETDALIVAGKVQKQHASLEVYIYEQQRNNMFVHHQVMLSSFPLDIEWLRVSLGSIGSNEHQKGNYAIVGSFLPEIQFWNLDVLEAVEPEITLGGELVSKSKKPKKFTNSNKKYKAGSHTDSVISLSLNAANFGVLASGSADSTVKIWDISKQSNIYTADHHKARVNKVEWNQVDVSILFTCSEDKTISILDSRFPGDKIVHKTVPNENVQSACWNINTPSQIAYVTDKGFLHFFDARMPDKILVSQQTHLSSVNDVKISRKNLLYTCSEDGFVRIWNINDITKPLAARNPKCGKLFCMDVMDLDDGPILSVGNEKGELFVWEIGENQAVDQYFKTH